MCGGIGDKLTCDTGDDDNYDDGKEEESAETDDDRDWVDLVLLL